MAKQAKDIKELLGLDGLSDWLHQCKKSWTAELHAVDASGTATTLHIKFNDGSSLRLDR